MTTTDPRTAVYRVIAHGNGGYTHRLVIDGKSRGFVHYPTEPSLADIRATADEFHAAITGEPTTTTQFRADGSADTIRTWAATFDAAYWPSY